jgi:catechol 2,3-dioxygenase-like lactoylglutathione lyase family enzyme
MKLEHVALNVADPVAVAAWYCTYLGMEIVRHIPAPAQTHFLHDGSGSIIEIYRNPPDQVPPYATMDPLIVHLAFSSDDAARDQARLLAAGATYVTEVLPPDGSRLVMLRDPWGLALQICQRATSLLATLNRLV